MTQLKRTMKHFSYGISKPSDLLEKLNWDAEKLTESPHPYDVFNFILTAAVLAEWIQQFYRSDSAAEPFTAPNKAGSSWLLPEMSRQWISDTACLPNRHCDVRRHISNALSICTHTANASKHFHWKDHGHLQAIGTNPPIGNWYQFFLLPGCQTSISTSRERITGYNRLRASYCSSTQGLLLILTKIMPRATPNSNFLPYDNVQ